MLAVAVAGPAGSRAATRFPLGDPNGGRLGAVTVNPVAEHRAAFESRAARIPSPPIPNPHVPAPVSKAKPSPKVNAARSQSHSYPEPRRETEAPVGRRPRRPTNGAPQQKDLPNQVYSTAGTKVSTRRFCYLAGRGGVGVGNNSPFGNQFGAYADLLRTRVAQYWKTTDVRADNASGGGCDNSPSAATASLDRHSHHAKERNRRSRYFRAARHYGRCAVSAAYRRSSAKSEAEIEFLFQLKQ